jgi:hypothetical protein
MSTTPLPLSLLCTVNVTTQSAGVTVPTFNQGLFIGNSGRIPSVGVNSRIRQYAQGSFLAEMTADGFEPTDPEVLAVSLYFGVDSQYAPAAFVWVGCQDPTAIAAGVIDADGDGYVVGDVITVVQAGAQLGQFKVTATGANGIITGLQLISGSQGHGYSVAAGLPTTGGTGAGATVSITAIGETPLQALTACRLAQPAWYCASIVSPTVDDADHFACTAFAQSASPAMQYVYGTQSATALSGATGNIFSLIKAANYSRGHGAYSTTQGGAAPSNVYIAAAVQGVAMGLNTGLANSNFTLAGKTLSGIVTEPLTTNQIRVFAGIPIEGTTGNNGNVYGNFANSYSLYEQGVNGNGTWFDQILGLDMLAADGQISIANLLATLPSIPQTDGGQTLVINAASGACARSASRGFLAGGTWTGPTILGLTPGTSLPNGYTVLSAPFSTQSPADRQARKGMPVYIAVILAGSQQSFVIGINVQQ